MGNFIFDKEVFKKVAAEFTGTAIILTLGCCMGNRGAAILSVGWGLVHMTATHIFAFMSGAHFNPAVSAAAAIVGVMQWQLMLCYMLAQLLGAFLGIILVYVTAVDSAGICIKAIYIKHVYVFALETFAIMFLILAYCAIWDKRSTTTQDSYSLLIGFVVTAASFATVS